MGLTRTLMVAGAGAALAYFLDPVSGRERRAKLRDYWTERVQGATPLEVDEPSPTIVVDAPKSGEAGTR
jgi:hypothetical protein